MTKGKFHRFVLSMLCVAGMYPASTAAQGISFDHVNGSVAWAVGNEEQAEITADIADAVQYATVTTGSDLKVETATYFDQDMMKYTPGTSNAGNVESVMIEYRVKMSGSITFQPTSVSYDAVKVGTDGATFAYSYTLDGVEAGATDVDAKTVLRNNGANAETAQLNHTVDITADATNDFTFRFYISKTANTKNICISNVKINGVVNGEKVVEVVKFENEPVTVTWPMNDAEQIDKYTTTLDEAISIVSFDPGITTLHASKPIANITDGDAQVVTTGLNFAAGSSKEDVLTWSLKPATGLTFTPTHLTGYVNRDGTDSENGITIKAQMGDGTVQTLGTWTALRSGKTSAQKPYDATAIYQYDITLTEEQQAALSGADMFYLTSTVGVGTGKSGIFGEVTVSGVVNGEMANISKYTLTTKANPENGGTITVYPKADEYESGAEVQLTAEQNFGYHFLNWTDAEGNVVSEEAKFAYTLTANAELTANFEAVKTYELTYDVEGGANLYMVQPTPAPTVIDGKNMYEEGTVVKLVASSNKILTFNNWSDGTTFAETKVTMDGDKSITASYSAVDYIVGWDFYNAGNNGRPADFASTADNESATLILRDAEGNTQGWLDKSTLGAGGYESLAGAAVNWKPLGQYYYQTKVNARDFYNIKVQAVMMYNYNIYSTQVLEYSLDGETWNEVTRLTMTANKKAYDIAGTLPAEADHAEQLFLRWRPDLTSEVVGTSAPDNDGTVISDIYVLADAEVYNDGVAPVLVSTVPENNATGASSSGKIVLNFDEKVKLTDNAKATLGNDELELSVSGKTVTAAYRDLEYSTEYVFNLAEGSVCDLAGNTMADAVTINFTTMTRPEIAKGMYDKEVATADEFLAALNEANSRADKDTRYRIFMHNGTYDLGNATLTPVSGNNISLIGESEDGVIIVNTPEVEGIGVTATLLNTSSNLYMQDITLKNDYPYANTTGRAVCLQDKGDKTIAKNVKLLSYQDTYYSNKSTSRFYWEDSEIHGTVDFLCGGGDVYYNRVNLVVENRSGNVISAPNGQLKYGYVFLDCEINCPAGAEGTVNGSYRLGRPWGAECRAQYINTRMNVIPAADGWGEMGGNKPMVFAEYNSTDKNGNAVDLSSRKVKFDGGTQLSAVLTEAQVEELSIANVMGGSDEWNPLAYTEQAPVPANVTIEGTTLAWDESNYVLLWAVCKDGKVVAFTTDNTYTADDNTATWSVRAANEMGGLSEAAVATIVDGISNVGTEGGNVTKTDFYNLQGIKVSESFKGTVIKIETLEDGRKISSKVNR